MRTGKKVDAVLAQRAITAIPTTDELRDLVARLPGAVDTQLPAAAQPAEAARRVG